MNNAGSAIGGFFGNLFNGGTGAQATSAASSEVATSSTGADASIDTAGWSARAPGSAKSSSGAPSSTGAFKLQVGAVRSRSDAEQMIAGLRDKHGAVIGAAAPAIDEAVFGNMGTFYRVQLGPYANEAEPGKICSALRPHGYDCLVTR